MKRIKLDVLDKKAIYFLKKLETKNLIHILNIDSDTDEPIKNNGAVDSQSIEEIEIRLKELHSEWS
jgi:hypothetical protein